MSEQTRAACVVTCADCEVAKETDDPNEAVAFYRRHNSLTGHDVDWERAALDPVEGAPAEGDLEGIVRGLEQHYDDDQGVPFGAVCAAMAKQGYTVGETLSLVHDLRMTGALFEPTDDHLRVV